MTTQRNMDAPPTEMLSGTFHNSKGRAVAPLPPLYAAGVQGGIRSCRDVLNMSVAAHGPQNTLSKGPFRICPLNFAVEPCLGRDRYYLIRAELIAALGPNRFILSDGYPQA